MPGPRASGKQKNRRQIDSDDEQLSDDDDALLQRLKKVERVDKQYLNQPVNRMEGTTAVKSMIAELNFATKTLTKTLDDIADLARDVAEASSKGPERQDATAVPTLADDPPAIKQLDADHRKVLDRIAEFGFRIAHLENLVRSFGAGQITDVATVFEDAANRDLQAYEAKSMRQKYGKVAKYDSFRTLIWESLYEGLAWPGLNKLLPKEDGDADDDEDDDEIAVEGSRETFKCPITLRLFEDPVKNIVCGHYFSRKPIEGLIRQGRGTTDCPYSGCHSKVRLDTIEGDADMARRVAAFARRLKESGPRTQSNTQFQTIVSSSDEED